MNSLNSILIEGKFVDVNSVEKNFNLIFLKDKKIMNVKIQFDSEIIQTMAESYDINLKNECRVVGYIMVDEKNRLFVKAEHIEFKRN